SIAELRRICGFPDDFILTGNHRQKVERLGRSVPPLMMKAIAEVVRDKILLRTHRQRLVLIGDGESGSTADLASFGRLGEVILDVVGESKVKVINFEGDATRSARRIRSYLMGKIVILAGKAANAFGLEPNAFAAVTSNDIM